MCSSSPGKSPRGLFYNYTNVVSSELSMARYSRGLYSKRRLENPLDREEIKPVSPKGNQPWIFTGRTDAEAPIIQPLDVKNQLIGKDPDAGKDWGQEEERTTEDEMVGWHHWHNGHKFEQALGDSGGQGSLECCSP